MNRISRYLTGFTLSICIYSLLTDGYNIYPVVIIGLQLLIIGLDLYWSREVKH
jgi:hypothetical protein